MSNEYAIEVSTARLLEVVSNAAIFTPGKADPAGNVFDGARLMVDGDVFQLQTSDRYVILSAKIPAHNITGNSWPAPVEVNTADLLRVVKFTAKSRTNALKLELCTTDPDAVLLVNGVGVSRAGHQVPNYDELMQRYEDSWTTNAPFELFAMDPKNLAKIGKVKLSDSAKLHVRFNVRHNTYNNIEHVYMVELSTRGKVTDYKIVTMAVAPGSTGL